MKINNKIIIIAILLGLITTSMLYYYLSDTKSEEVNLVKMTEVVTAVNTIPIHVKITKEMLTTISIPDEALHPDAILDMETVIGGITNAEIIKGEQLLSSRVIADTSGAPLSYRIQENMRAISIPMNEISGVAGYIVPGDRIDVLVYYKDTAPSAANVVYTQFQNIEVLEKGPYSTAVTEAQSEVATSLTLLVTPEQAEMIAYARINGDITCTLRNPIDNSKVEIDEFGIGNFDTWSDR